MDTLRFYFVTWNVATGAPKEELYSLLDYPALQSKHRQLPDFYVIGLQEVKSQPQNILLDSIFNDAWTSAFNKILCRLNYARVNGPRLQGMVLIVYVLKKHLLHLRDIELQFTKTGLGGIWGNKGAVSIRFNIYGCSICLVNSHFAAHDHLLADRVAEYNTVIKSHTYNAKETNKILYHDYLFWIGDLNFRIKEHVPSVETAAMIADIVEKTEKNNYSQLLKHDQLRAVMESGDAFSELQEPEIRFPPTFKYEMGKSKFDQKRRPAWTDRILYKVVADNYENIVLRADVISYNSLMQYTQSDHKPVIAEFNVKVFSNYTERTVEFIVVNNVWYIGDVDFATKCSLSPDVKVNNSDWIGIYDANFESIDDYISYEYLSKVTSPVPENPGGLTSNFTICFPVGSGVRTPGFYRFIYISQPNGSVRSVLGISEPFEVCTREDQLASMSLPSTSAASHDNCTPHTADAFLSDLATLDVASITRHFSNELSID